jgi:hypothetical protein
MLTLFSTAKPFQGHAGIIQRNAIKSWTLLDPDCEVILFGDDVGAAEVAAEFGIRHEPEVQRSEYGTKRLDYIFARAQEIGRHNVFCYINCDIILGQSFRRAVACVTMWSKRFLMVGQRWDTPVREPIDFNDASWEARLHEFALRSGKQQQPYAIDFFVFSRGMYLDMPAFVVGRVCWDHWIPWRARSKGVPVVDATEVVLAVHQNHDFGYHPRGLDGVQRDIESRRNYRLAGGQPHLYTIEHATHRISGGLVEFKPGHRLVPVTYLTRAYCNASWYWLLQSTLKFRQATGLNRAGLSNLRTRLRSMIGQ